MRNWWSRSRGAAGLGAAVAAPLAASALLAALRSQVPNTDAALVLVVVVVAVASGGRRASGYLAAVSAAFWFDFFLTVPYYRVEMTRSADIRTAVLLLLVGVAVSEIGVAARHQRERADESSELLGLISSVATQAAGFGPSHRLIEQVRHDVELVLGAREVRFERFQPPSGALRPRFEQDGRVRWGEVDWDVDRLGLPAEEIDLPLRSEDLGIGRFVVLATPSRPCPLQRRLVAVVLADQVGAVLARGGPSPRPLQSGTPVATSGR
jgi:hypothetical protein